MSVFPLAEQLFDLLPVPLPVPMGPTPATLADLPVSPPGPPTPVHHDQPAITADPQETAVGQARQSRAGGIGGRPTPSGSSATTSRSPRSA
jgi:hypothetical protein